MDIKLYRLILCFLLVFFIFPSTVFAHPGRTAADGCHYCRTNCDKWGVSWNERHCHGGGVAAPVEEPPVVIKKVVPTRTPPTRRPTLAPTRKPTLTPTKKPTNTPTLKPTLAPTLEPTKIFSPTSVPTLVPTIVPSSASIFQLKDETKTVQQENIFSRFFGWFFKKK
jgi:hypothetical protein